MPNIKSAEKRVRVTAAKTLQNKMAKSSLKTAIKSFYAKIEAPCGQSAPPRFPAECCPQPEGKAD